MAELEKLLCSDSRVEAVKKINAIIENGGGGGLEIGDIGFTQMAIDETKGKRRVLNGQLIIQDQYVQFTNIIKNSVALNSDLACTESEWQTAVTMSANGVCDKFVIDDEAGTIRLPKYPEYLDLSINGTKTSTVYGTVSSTGGTFTIPGANGKYYNLFAKDGSGSVTYSGTQAATNILKVDVTTSSEQIKGTYFIQVATGAETEDNIINEIELNNPFSLLDYKFSEYELNNLSWLRSESQYNSNATYPAVYELLLKIYNGTETKAGVSVKLTSETFTDYDFVLNTADETFRLPIKVKLASGKAVVGNGKTLGLTNGTTNYGLYGGTDYGTFIANNLYDSNVGATGTASSGGEKSLGITTDPTKSGIETSDSDLYLYFYVGETVQNANLINAGRIEEVVSQVKADKLDRSAVKAYITQTYVSGTSGYRIWSDGFKEQWGVSPSGADQSTQTVTLLKAFSNANYNVVAIQRNGPAGNYTNGLRIVNYTTASFQINYRTGGDTTAYWRACGY